MKITRFVKAIDSIDRRKQKVYDYVSRKSDVKYSSILMFHDISDNGDRFSISRSEFQMIIEKLITEGYSFKPLSEIKQDTGRGQLYITFDDGFKSTMDVAVPILREHRIPYCIYIATAFLDKPNYLSSNDVISLTNDDNCIIGAHTHSHEMARYISKESFFSDVKKNVEILHALTKRKPIHFAFPYGSVYAVSRSNINSVKEMGFETISLTKQMHLTKTDIREPYKLPRYDMSNTEIIKRLIT